MLIGAIADIHGNFDAMRRAMTRHADVPWCGHHHRFTEADREGVRSVCIDRINRSYVLIDASTLEYQKIDQ